MPVAVARRLAGEGDHAAGAQDAVELAERLVEVGQVVQHRVAEDEVEGLVGERQRARLRRDRLDLEARAARRWPRSVSSIPGEMSVARGVVDHARLQQVQGEVAGARADLQRAAEAAAVLAERLSQLAEHLRLADLAEVDAPLGVVAGGRAVVVAGVDVADLLRGVGAGHAQAERT